MSGIRDWIFPESHAEREANLLLICLLNFVVISLALDALISGGLALCAKKAMRTGAELINAVNKELAILGFISMLLIVCENAGISEILNDRFLHETEAERVAKEERLLTNKRVALPTAFKEFFEFTHVFIFFVMVAYILQTAILLGLLLNQMSRFKKQEVEIAGGRVEGGSPWEMILSSASGSGENLAGSSTKPSSGLARFFGMQQRFRGRGIGLAPLLNSCEHAMNVSFAEYLGLAGSELVAECVELPPAILILMGVVALIMMPSLTIMGVGFLIVLVCCGIYLTVGAGVLYLTSRMALRQNKPETSDVTQLLRNRDLRAGLQRSPLEYKIDDITEWVVSQNFLHAKVDDATDLIKKDYRRRPRNPTEWAFLGRNPRSTLRITQLLLACLAGYVASVAVTATSRSRSFYETWGQREGKILGPIIAALVIAWWILWVLTLERFTMASVIEFQTDRYLLHELKEEADHRQLVRDANLWQYLALKSLSQDWPREADAHGAVNDLRLHNRESAMERFGLLPYRLQRALRQTFAELAVEPEAATDLQGEQLSRVIPPKRLKEAFRVLGIASVEEYSVLPADKESTLHKQVSNAYMRSSSGSASSELEETPSDNGLTFGDFVATIMIKTGYMDRIADPLERERINTLQCEHLFRTIDVGTA